MQEDLGWTNHNIMRVMAKIDSYQVVVLIDSGSTHNFISEKITSMPQLSVTPTGSFEVKVANGKLLKCQGKFDNISISLQGIPFALTLYAFAINWVGLGFRNPLAVSIGHCYM